MSPTLMERYLAAAQKISRLAVGTPPPSPNVDYVRLGDDLQQDEHIEGLPVGTRGGVSIPYTFPMDAEYVIKVRLARDILENIPRLRRAQHLEVSLDGERVQVFTCRAVHSRPPLRAAAGSGRTGTSGTGAGRPPQAAAAADTAPAAAPAQGRGARPRPSVTQVDTGPRCRPEGARTAESHRRHLGRPRSREGGRATT